MIYRPIVFNIYMKNVTKYYLQEIIKLLAKILFCIVPLLICMNCNFFCFFKMSLVLDALDISRAVVSLLH